MGHELPSRSLAQFAREAAESDNDPWACTRCGCKDSRVLNTYDVAKGIARRRVCRNCGQGLLKTIETIVPK